MNQTLNNMNYSPDPHDAGFWHNIYSANYFMHQLKKYKIHRDKIKSTLYGGTAFKVIKNIRQAGQSYFDKVKKKNDLWSRTVLSISEVINNHGR